MRRLWYPAFSGMFTQGEDLEAATCQHLYCRRGVPCARHALDPPDCFVRREGLWRRVFAHRTATLSLHAMYLAFRQFWWVPCTGISERLLLFLALLVFLDCAWHSVASGPNTDVVSRWHHGLGTSFLRQKGGMKRVTLKCLMWSSGFCVRFGLVTILLPEKTLPIHKYTSGLARFVRAVSGSPQHFAETSAHVEPTCVFALRLCTS